MLGIPATEVYQTKQSTLFAPLHAWAPRRLAAVIVKPCKDLMLDDRP